MTVMNLISCPAGGDAYSIPPPPITLTKLPHTESCHSISETDQPIDMDHELATPRQHTDTGSETSTPTDSSTMESDTETPHQSTDAEANIPTTALLVDEISPTSSPLQPSEISDETPVTTPPRNVEPDAAIEYQAHNENSTLLQSIFRKDNMPDQEGLLWEPDNFGHAQPKWTREPDIEAIKQTVQYLYPGLTVEIEFLGQGGFNKVYAATIDGKEFVMKVTLPVDPYFKTESEVATMDFVRSSTQLPIPKVFAYQSNRNNPIRFEWILMEKMPGEPFGEVWMNISREAKEKMVRQIAQAQATLFQHQFKGIGSFYQPSRSQLSIPSSGFSLTGVLGESHHSHQSLAYTTDGAFDLPDEKLSKPSLNPVDRIVSLSFFWDTRLRHNISRGPYHSSRDWLATHLGLIQNECIFKLDQLPVEDLSEDDEADKDDFERTLKLAKDLSDLLPRIFESHQNCEPSIIFHGDLSRHNILVSQSGELTAVLDWEFVQLMPLWKACDYAKFLIGPSRSDASSIPQSYTGASPDLGNRLWHREAAFFRKIFLDEITSTKEWVEVFDKSQILRDFDLAVAICGQEFMAKGIREWIQDVISGTANASSLIDKFY
ncbi:hypothetical protein N7452_001532 [Penicillium brevicompactum]|uniref:Aminoglycoside phosphotransferase domain-containing protein n=1 Tax=Penicillium brevicompactum TaxID=5074 RepID=A0A9W9R843_PENBR|nr:hypothetical protein N7452_001532 [Penicillium brevicompactum]